MMKTKLSDEMKKNVHVLIGIIVIILLLAFSSVLFRQNHKFAYADYLDEEVISFEGESITLREFGYYIYELEDFTQKQALKYHPSDPLDYWNTHFSAGIHSQFVSEMARETAVNKCLGDLVYAAMAQEAGFELPAEEEAGIRSEADEWYDALTQENRKILGIDRATVYRIVQRSHLASAYAYEYSEKADLTGYSGDVATLLSGGGDYFNDKLLSKYDVRQNTELIEEFPMGRITVNHS